MALSRPLRFAASCTTLLAIAAGGLVAAETDSVPDTYSFNELRIGYVGSAAPTVRQKDPVSTGWTGGESRGWRAGLTWLRGEVPTQGFLSSVYGAQFSLGSYEVGPDETSVVTLTQPMIDVYYGWQYGIFDSESIHGFAELLPFVGAGANFVDFGGETRIGPQIEGGVRVGAFLTEHNWLAGLTLAYVVGKGQVKDNSSDTTLDLQTNGFNFGFEFGHRF